MDINFFLKAQDEYYSHALQEIKNGCKQTHWMWFVFPQVSGLGNSEMALKYALKSKEEAIEYFKHPITGNRLLEITSELLAIENKSIRDILGYPDHLKLKSSMTLFDLIQSNNEVFSKVLAKYFDGERCQHTIKFIM